VRLDVAGDTLLERIAVLSGMLPASLIQVTFGAGYARSIVAGTRLGLFEALAEGDADVPELATRLSCSEIGTEVLANALAGMDVLRRKRGRYSLGKSARKFLLRDAPSSMVDGILFVAYCQTLLEPMEESIRTGEVVRFHDMEHPPELWSVYMGALGSFAKLLSGQVISKIKPTAPPLRVLDVGGGHGMFCVALCRKYPELRAEVLDLPGACAAGRGMVAAEGFADRVTHREGDFRVVEWGPGYDLVLLFHVMHNATPDEARLLIDRAFASLNPGGTVVVYDASHAGAEGPIDASAGWNELFFFMISGAQAWPEATMRGWMTDAGFTRLATRELLGAPEVVITGVKPAG